MPELVGKSPMRVLVADDDPVAREILSRTLARWNFDVTTAADGLQAWQHLAAWEGPFLGILDWMMPGMDGPDVCRRVRKERPLVNTYLVLLTALESRGDIVAGLGAGADDYIVKPFDPGELRARLQVGVRVLTLQERLEERVRELESALDNVKQLQGLLPICCYCKRVRADDQYWQQVDSYITQHSEVRFSHGICPPCLVKVERELEDFGIERRATGPRRPRS